MASWDGNKNQWGAQPNYDANYQSVYQPGPTPQYGQPAYPQPSGPPPAEYDGDYKSPYEGDRFKPKKKVNDIFFLIFFILQVRAPLSPSRGRHLSE